MPDEGPLHALPPSMLLTNVSLDATQELPDYAVVALCLISFVALWLFLSFLASFIGGWYSLAQRYRTRELTGTQWSGLSGQMRWFTNYGSILTLGANQDGLYLACMFPFSFMQPPLLIPWTEITVRRTDGWIFKYITFTIDRQMGIPLRIRTNRAERLRSAAGKAWPVEILAPE